MVKLFCAIVGEAITASRSAFPVVIDADQTVGDLKDAVKTKINYFGPAYELQLFLAKNDKGRGAWVTEAEAMSGVSDTTDLKLLKSARVKIGDIGLSEDDVRLQVTKEEVEDLKGPVHVLVLVPGDPTIEKLKKQKKDDGSSAQDGSYYWLVADLFSLLWPLDKIHSTKKDV